MDQAGRIVVRRGGGYLHENPASTFFSSAVHKRVGFFDSVRTGADSEFAWRVRECLGSSAVGVIKRPLALGLHHNNSLTSAGVAAFDEHRYSAVRTEYWESWNKWHEELFLRKNEEIFYMPYPLLERRFEAPIPILP